MLLDAGTDANLSSPISVHAANGRGDIVHLLLERGADVNTVDSEFGTIPFSSGVVGHPSMAKTVISYHAKINLSNTLDSSYPFVLLRHNTLALMLVFAVGEYYVFLDTDDVHVPTPIMQARSDISLKNMCHLTIYCSIIHNREKKNMFDAMNEVPLPNPLKDYVL